MPPLRTVLSLTLLGLASSAGHFGSSHHHSTYHRPSSHYGAPTPSTSYGAPTPSTSYGAPRTAASNFARATPQTSFQSSSPSFQSSSPSFQSSSPSFQSSSPSLKSSSPSFQSSSPSFQSSSPSFQSTSPSFQSSSPSLKSSSPSFQKSAPSFQSSAPSFQKSAPSFRSSAPSQTGKVFNSRPQGFQSQGVRAVQGLSRYYLSWGNGDQRKYTWDEADHECRRFGMRLISLTSFEKEAEINTLLDASPVPIPYYWTSATRQGNGGLFMWGDKKHTLVCRNGSRRDVCFENWGRTGQDRHSQPDNAEGFEDCLAVLNRFYPGDGITWHDIACHHKKQFVCEPYE